MKRMKKFMSLALALIMVLAMTTTAFAAETYSITIDNDKPGHTYEAYQIFKGDLHEGVLSNIKWGSSVSNANDLEDASKVAEKLDKSYTGTDKITLDDLLKMITLGEKFKDSDESSNSYVIDGLPAGYYLVKDKDNSVTGNDAYTEYIVKVVGNVTANPKSDVPEVEKKVKDTNDSTGETSDWQDSADYDIGDNVPFRLKATLASNVSKYDTYKVVFHDTLSAGLTYNNDAKVTFNDVDVTNYFTITEKNGKLTISCNDVKAFDATDSSEIFVEYTAKLNENANIGAVGNPNEVYLEYSNNPNNSEGGETGTTPEDKVIVFTYKTIINKVDKENKPLTGAEFKLEKYDKATGSWIEVAVVKNDAETTFTFSGLDDGKYRLTETKTPAGYNTIAPIEFEITADHEILSDNPTLKDLNGNVTTGEIEFAKDVPNGSLSADVINNKGAELPETGGMGTTMFYIIGSLLVIGAGVLLVTKKRMGSESK